MTGKEVAWIEKIFLKLVSSAVIAAALAGMYGLRSSAAVPAEEIFISQFYGAGCEKGMFSNDYIELYNSGEAAVELNGYLLTYSSDAGEGEESSTVDSDGNITCKSLQLIGTIPAHGYFLVCGSGNSCSQEDYSILSYNQLWNDLVIDDQATVTLKLYKEDELVDMVSTEGCSCRYMISGQTAVLCGNDGRRRGCETGLRTFYWNRPLTEEYKDLYEPRSSYGPADGSK